MHTIDMKNAVAITVREETIPMFMLPQGHVRCISRKHDDGTFSFITCVSDKKVDISQKHSHNEVWENQTVEPVFAIHFESVEQIEAYRKMLDALINRAKTTK